jgi:hypothetical protein
VQPKPISVPLAAHLVTMTPLCGQDALGSFAMQSLDPHYRFLSREPKPADQVVAVNKRQRGTLYEDHPSQQH